MAGSSPIRGSRIGGSSMAESTRGPLEPRRQQSFFCANGHSTHLTFAVNADVPDLWDCPSCGLPAGQDESAPPAAPSNEPYKTHLAYVRERRSDDDGEALLAEALARLAARRESRY